MCHFEPPDHSQFQDAVPRAKVPTADCPHSPDHAEFSSSPGLTRELQFRRHYARKLPIDFQLELDNPLGGMITA